MIKTGFHVAIILAFGHVAMGVPVACGAVDRTARAGECPVLSAARQPYSFVVLGDIHYGRPAFASQRIAAAIAESVRDVRPAVAFVCQTGDLILGEDASHRQLDTAGVQEEMTFAVTNLLESFRVPLFVAVGNHDKNAGGAPYRETVLPLLSRELGEPLERAAYAFRYGNACFVFLDYGDYSKAGKSMDYAAQARFFEATLKQAHADAAVRHVFVFGHFPLWPVVRPGFCSDRFTDSVLPALTRFPADAYFCGHTHNTGAWVRRVCGVPVVQIMGVALDRSDPLVPMESVRTSLIPRGGLSYGWGCLSGPPNGYFLVSVDGPRVRVQFRSGRTVIRAFEWQEPGKIADTVTPPVPAAAVLSADALSTVVSAELVFTPWAAADSDFSFVLNGEKVGAAHLKPMPQWAAFASEMRVRIPAEKFRAIRLANDVTIENPARALFGVGNLRLDVRLRDGTKIGTGVCDRFLFSARRSEAAALHRSEWGWEIVPDGVSAAVALGQPLGPAHLCFACAPPVSR